MRTNECKLEISLSQKKSLIFPFKLKSHQINPRINKLNNEDK